MLKGKSSHSTVTIGNKMFVIAIRYLDNGCEVFDSITNKFTFIKRNLHMENIDYYSPKIEAISVGYKVHVFCAKKCLYSKEKSRILTFCYDVKENTWNSEDNCDPQYVDCFSCAKVFKH